MCRTGGPYCYERKLSRPKREKLNTKRVARLTRKIDNHPRSDEDRSARARAQAYLNGDTEATSNLSQAVADASQPDGGGTIRVADGAVPTTGFCYSPYPERSKVFASASDLTVASLMQYAKDNEDLLSQQGNYVGLWNDPEDGKVYLDVSVVTQEASEARVACKEHDQIAFFDLQDFTSVTVDQTATSGQGS